MKSVFLIFYPKNVVSEACEHTKEKLIEGLHLKMY